MKSSLAAILVAPLAAISFAACAAPRRAPEPAHDKRFWRELAAHGGGLPAGIPARDAALELASCAGSTDPELRDDLGYSLSESWVRQGLLAPETLHELVRFHLAHFDVGLGEGEGDGIFLRSFSALDLVPIVELDARDRFLDEGEFRELFDKALAALERERDRRGWVEGKRWAHAIAHTADLLEALARGRFMRTSDQPALLAAVDHGLDGPNAWGENERLAVVLQTLARREDFDETAFTNLLERWKSAATRVWQVQPFDPALFRRADNAKQLLRALHVGLVSERRPVDRTEHMAHMVLEALKRMP